MFLFEAFLSGKFSRYVAVEVDAQLVAAVRGNGGAYTVNIARPDRIDQVTVPGVELYNPNVPEDRPRLLQAIAEADELATALPSVTFYDAGANSVARLLAGGLSQRCPDKPCVIYTAENDNHAAEKLTDLLRRYLDVSFLGSVQILNTVIGKMSGVIGEDDEIRRTARIQSLTPALSRAVLVEEFNRILISRITLPDFQRGIDVFIEKDDLLPFEEAKLYGHNAIHALLGYLADLRGLATMAEAGQDAALMHIARAAFLEESGAALCRRHQGLHDALFTPEGYRAYAEDLLERMIRPNLNDRVSRVIRDHVRKLGYDDRLYGTMRLALQQGIRPVNLARGSAAAILSLIRHPAQTPAGLSLPASAGDLTFESLGSLLRTIWSGKQDAQAEELTRLTWEALRSLD